MIKIRIIFCILLSFTGCSRIDPRDVDIDIPSGIPEVKKTEFDKALRELGRMAEIYGVKTRIMIDKISDNTGASEHTKAEIPYDVTEMTVSALNSIGRNITFIPYRPDVVANLKNLGYQDFKKKIIPSVIITGGITEFDRGMETSEESMDLGYETDKFGDETPFGIDYMQGKKQSLARITIDYNMIDMETMSGLSGVQAINTMQVHKGIGKKELGFTIFGPTLGLKGEVKKVEGRHAALRILIQVSMIQLIGKYLDLPFWRLIPNTKLDETVDSYVTRKWVMQMNNNERVCKIQELLILHGYNNVGITGILDDQTKKSIHYFSLKMKSSKDIDVKLYKDLYYNIPLDDSSIIRRYIINKKKSLAASGGAQQLRNKNETGAAQVSKMKCYEISHPLPWQDERALSGGGHLRLR
jgi:hypothetical protein